MRYLFTICLLFAFVIPVLSQNKISKGIDSVKTYSHNPKKDMASMDSLINSLRQSLGKAKKLPANKNGIRFIPIPPANDTNSVADLLPLHKPGNTNMKFLGEKKKE
jgi:hypothetical protein